MAVRVGRRAYTPKALSAPEYRTLERLTDLIVPVENGAPGAVAAGAAAWIDMLASENAQLKETYTTGLAWLDAAMKTRGAADFVSATPAEQTALLDLIAYRRNQTPELAPGIEFFTWARRMTVDAFYTSEIGIRDIDYQGNRPMMAYPSPTEAIAYALKKSGLLAYWATLFNRNGFGLGTPFSASSLRSASVGRNTNSAASSLITRISNRSVSLPSFRENDSVESCNRAERIGVNLGGASLALVDFTPIVQVNVPQADPAAERAVRDTHLDARVRRSGELGDPIGRRRVDCLSGPPSGRARRRLQRFARTPPATVVQTSRQPVWPGHVTRCLGGKQGCQPVGPGPAGGSIFSRLSTRSDSSRNMSGLICSAKGRMHALVSCRYRFTNGTSWTNPSDVRLLMRSASFRTLALAAAGLHDAQQILGLRFPDAVGDPNRHLHHQVVHGRTVGVDARDLFPRDARHAGSVLEEVVNHGRLEQHGIDDLVVEQDPHRADLVPEHVAAGAALHADEGHRLDDVRRHRDVAEGCVEVVHADRSRWFCRPVKYKTLT